MSPLPKRRLGRSGIQVSAMGLGCWAIGGPFWRGETPVGWGVVEDEESIRAIHRGLELGIDFFDTADVYGAGHSERVLGRALAGRRDRVVIATKFGNIFDEATRQVTSESASPDHIRRACEASLRRLDTDYIDLYQFHLNYHPMAEAPAARETLEALVAEGKIRSYGWSTMGLLTGKYTPSSQSLPLDDVRSERSPEWMRYFKDGKPHPDWLKKLDAVRQILTSGGRTLSQGALAWLWARTERAIPIPGFRTVTQVDENCGALVRGPLTDAQMGEIDRVLAP